MTEEPRPSNRHRTRRSGEPAGIRELRQEVSELRRANERGTPPRPSSPAPETVFRLSAAQRKHGALTPATAPPRPDARCRRGRDRAGGDDLRGVWELWLIRGTEQRLPCRPGRARAHSGDRQQPGRIQRQPEPLLLQQVQRLLGRRHGRVPERRTVRGVVRRLRGLGLAQGRSSVHIRLQPRRPQRRRRQLLRVGSRPRRMASRHKRVCRCARGRGDLRRLAQRRSVSRPRCDRDQRPAQPARPKRDQRGRRPDRLLRCRDRDRPDHGPTAATITTTHLPATSVRPNHRRCDQR